MTSPASTEAGLHDKLTVTLNDKGPHQRLAVIYDGRWATATRFRGLVDD